MRFSQHNISSRRTSAVSPSKIQFRCGPPLWTEPLALLHAMGVPWFSQFRSWMENGSKGSVGDGYTRFRLLVENWAKSQKREKNVLLARTIQHQIAPVLPDEKEF